MTLLVGMRYDD